MSVVGKWCREASEMARSLDSIVLGWALLALQSAWRTHSAMGDTLESGEVLDFSVFRVVQEDL